jgi:hypothetical protein
MDGQVRTLSELADQLDVHPHLLEQMLSDLVRAGYVRNVLAQCTGHCQGCGSGSVCGLMHGGRIWMVTEKGRRAGQRPPGAAQERP